MSTEPTHADRTTLAKPLAPEDLRVGDCVAVLDEEHEWAAASWYCDPPLGAEPVIRVRMRPSDPVGPLRVIAACLPFVFAKPLRGDPITLDLRGVRLARLDASFFDLAERATEPKEPPKPGETHLGLVRRAST